MMRPGQRVLRRAGGRSGSDRPANNDDLKIAQRLVGIEPSIRSSGPPLQRRAMEARCGKLQKVRSLPPVPLLCKITAQPMMISQSKNMFQDGAEKAFAAFVE